jgi:hypothetical protein
MPSKMMMAVMKQGASCCMTLIGDRIEEAIMLLVRAVKN